MHFLLIREVLSGRDDSGMVGATPTPFLCQHCKNIYDVLISSKACDAKSYKEPFCLQNRRHNILRWKWSDFSPKCRGKMKRKGPIFLWD